MPDTGFQEQWKVVGVAPGIFSLFIGCIGLIAGGVEKPEKGEATECVFWDIKPSVIKHSCTQKDLVDLLPMVPVRVAADSLVTTPAVVKKCFAVCFDFGCIER